MKNRKLFTLALAILLIAALFAGCGGSSYGNGALEQVKPGAGDYTDNLTNIQDSVNTGSSSDTPSYQKKIRKLEMNVETEDLDALLWSYSSGQRIILGIHRDGQQLLFHLNLG